MNKKDKKLIKAVNRIQEYCNNQHEKNFNGACDNCKLREYNSTECVFAVEPHNRTWTVLERNI